MWLPNFLPSKLAQRDFSVSNASHLSQLSEQPYLDASSLRVVEIRVFGTGEDCGGPPSIAVVLGICSNSHPHDRFVCLHPTALRSFVKAGCHSDIDVLTKEVCVY